MVITAPATWVTLPDTIGSCVGVLHCLVFGVSVHDTQWRTQEFGSGGRVVQQIQLRTEDRENGDLGTVAPYSGALEAAVIWYRIFHFI